MLLETIGNSVGQFANCSVRSKMTSGHPISITPTGSFFNTMISASFDDITDGQRTASSLYGFQLNGSPIANPYTSTITGDTARFEGFYNSGSTVIGLVQLQTDAFGAPFSGLTTCD
jgi:hypothetical protein